MFDVTMGSFDGAEICELVGLYILDELSLLFGKDYVGLYRDDGLLLLKSNSGRIADLTRKKLHQTFDKFGLKITVEVSHQSVNFLDITLNLADGSYHPYRKPNNNPLYISSRSNHPSAILKHLPESINKRISQLSSDQDAFDSSAHLYQDALRRSNYQHKLSYQSKNNPKMPKRKRSRNITWFNPPFSQNVQSKIGREFLRLLDTHFPKSSPLSKIFNRNTVKVSYSCLKNVKSVIANHNNKILTQKPIPPTPSEKMCNCRNFNLCPLETKCLTKSIVYKASVTEENSNDTKVYIGSTSTTFKERFRNHKKSIANPLYATNTELSKYVWSLKEKNKEYNIKWDIVKQVPSYKSGGKQCSLCSNEKLYILKAEKGSNLNKRSELFSRCIHQRRFLAGRFNRANSTSARKKPT